ncbi:alpha/beta fold hydrolase [Rossellomorea aquimaris]|uniref:alpha/beta fold hydrolase n=1 Tax=Rossellomorea aquimaris TaxID=189382 RepID=UPI0007D061FB|nr:alpha/beta hydrolase [Rossellomorea aquimaris]
MQWEQQLVHTKRGTFEVFRKGVGQPLCITHLYSEFNETGDHYADCFTQYYHVILVNLRECGHSVLSEEPFDLSMIYTLLDLEEIRMSLGYTSWSFAGHSTGGILGVIYGIRYSSSLEQLIITGASPRDYTDCKQCIYHQEHPQFKVMQDLLIALKNPKLSTVKRKELSEERTKLSLYHSEKYHDWFNGKIQKKMNVLRLNHFSSELLIYDVTNKLPQITAQTLLLCGRHDVQCPVELTYEMHEGISNSEMIIFEESNHYPFLEERDKFQKAIQQFQTQNI